MADMEGPSTEFQARKEFLLHQARRARMKFVLQARDIPKTREDSKSGASEQINADDKNTSSTAIKLAQKQRNKVPAAECVQQVLDFFHQLLPDDAEAVDVDQLLLSVQDTDVEEDLRNFQATVGSGTLSEYDLFLRKLLLPQAAHIVKLLQQFVLKTQSRYRNLQILPTSAFGNNSSSSGGKNNQNIDKNSQSGPLKADEIWDFIDQLCQAMQETELWASGPASNPNAPAVLTSAAALAHMATSSTSSTTNSSLLPLDPAVEVFVERFLFRKIGDFLIAGDKDESRRNNLTAQRLHALQFITAEHLDIRSLEGYSQAEITELIANARQHLLLLSQHSAPSDKVTCLRNCCQQIALLLKQLKVKRDSNNGSHHHSGNVMTSLPGADELLPMMIYVVLKTPIPELHSQIRFLQTYTRPRQMLSEAGYLVTQFVSAVYFLDNVDARALMIEPDAFDTAMLQAKQRAKSELLAHQQQQDKKKTTTKSINSNNNPAEVLDLQHILAQYKAEMKAIDQTFSSGNDHVGNVGTNNSLFPNLSEYRAAYQQPAHKANTTSKKVSVKSK